MSGRSVRAAFRTLSKASAGLTGRHGTAELVPPSLAAAERCMHSSAKCSSKRNIVKVSSIMLQDGLDIQELPVLVRLLDISDKRMIPFPTTHTYPGEPTRSLADESGMCTSSIPTEEEKIFQQRLQQCYSGTDLFELLEMPFERVTGQSAVAVLKRISELQHRGMEWDNLHSFIRNAVMNELQQMVKTDMADLPSASLISLVECYVNMSSFTHQCRSAINGEIEKRLVEGMFSLSDLCHVSNLLQVSDRGDGELFNSIWVYIGNHYQDITEDNVAAVLTAMPATERYMLKMVAKRLHTFWWKMKAQDAAEVMANLCRLNSKQVSMLNDMGRWLYLNINQITESGLMKFLAAFIQFRFIDVSFITALERYVPARGEDLGTDLLGMVMEYFRSRRHFSPIVMDTAAAHFVKRGQDYSPPQIFAILRPFGHLNYLPKDNYNFLLQTEKMLEQHFSELNPAQLAELLCCFAFVEKIPLNFVRRVLTPGYLYMLKDLVEKNKQGAGLWLEMLQAAIRLESSVATFIPCPYRARHIVCWPDKALMVMQTALQKALTDLIGEDFFSCRTMAINTVYWIDAEIHFNEDGKPVNFKESLLSDARHKRLALMIMMPDHYCINSPHLLGEYAMRLRHLRKMGYHVVEVTDRELMLSTNKVACIAEKLKPWLRLETSDNAETPAKT